MDRRFWRSDAHPTLSSCTSTLRHAGDKSIAMILVSSIYLHTASGLEIVCCAMAEMLFATRIKASDTEST